MSKHYIIRKDGVVQSYFFKSDKKFHVNYELAVRTRKIIKGKRIRVYAKRKPEEPKENFSFTFVLAFATGAGRNKAGSHWEDSAFEIWVEKLVLDYEPDLKWLQNFVGKKLEPELRRQYEGEELDPFKLAKVKPSKGKAIGDFWGVEIETTSRLENFEQLAKLFRTPSYEEVKACRKTLNLI